MKKQILDCSSVFTFVVKKYPCKKEEISEQIKNFYPFSVKGKSIVVRGIKKRKETVFFIFKKTSFDTEWVSFVLFILNRYKEGNFAGFIDFAAFTPDWKWFIMKSIKKV